jgi:hypothetical protein
VTRSPLRALAGALLTAGVVGALLTAPTASASAASAAAAGLAPAAPAVGSCHALTPREGAARSDSDAPVPCRRQHTSRTIAVPRAPERVDMTDDAAVAEFGGAACSKAFKRSVTRSTRSLLLSSYALYYFAPTRAQVEQGARWIRCDVVLYGGGTFAPLPPARRPQLGRPPFGNREARCYTQRPGGYLITVCSRPHALRAKTAYPMSGRAYPSDRQFRAVAERRCEPVAGPGWSIFPPSREQWRAGNRWVVCTAKTRR